MSNSQLILINKQLRLKTANEFFINGVNIFHKLLTKGDPVAQTQNIRIWNLPSPIINISFAIEVCLKTLMEGSRRTHSLYNLYCELDPTTQNKIEIHFEKCKSFNYQFIDFVISELNTPNFHLMEQLKKLLKKHCKGVQTVFLTLDTYMNQGSLTYTILQTT